jgi:histidyl-tRNA synthetase
MSQKPSVPKGTRDFLPDEMAKRNYIFGIIKEIFSLYGYVPIETPAMENLSSLLGKYGEEGDKLLFRILNSGDFIGKLPPGVEFGDSLKISNMICDRGLRYDLTVPFARFVVQHHGELTFPFKRYQVQPVWRADRPQKGRYREFFQCDADVIGSDSLLNEVELTQVIDEIFLKLKLKAVIKLNNRKILTGIAEIIGQPEKITAMTVAIDKIDKVGMDEVCLEMIEKGISPAAVDKLKPVLQLSGSYSEKLDKLAALFKDSEAGTRGVNEMRRVLEPLKDTGIANRVEFDVSLARGLNYYTGTIFEVKSAEVSIGSICGGGRYDDLTGIFGLPGVSGVGISFGADRIYDVLEQTGGFPPALTSVTKVMFVNFGDKEAASCLKMLKSLRQTGISAELYPDNLKMKKQLNYANSRKIPFVALVGETEAGEGSVTVKNMATGTQEKIRQEDLAAWLTGK